MEDDYEIIRGCCSLCCMGYELSTLNPPITNQPQSLTRSVHAGIRARHRLISRGQSFKLRREPIGITSALHFVMRACLVEDSGVGTRQRHPSFHNAR